MGARGLPQSPRMRQLTPASFATQDVTGGPRFATYSADKVFRGRPRRRSGRMGKPERRQQILNEARDVFARRGYHNAKIDDIVAAAGIARGTFYLYFQDKRTIFEEIVDRMLTRVGMSIVRVDVERPVENQIKENIRRIVEVLLDDRSTTRILLSDARGVDP